MRTPKHKKAWLIAFLSAAVVLFPAPQRPAQWNTVSWSQREAITPGIGGGSQFDGSPSLSDGSLSRYAYFIACSGAYVKVDTATQRIVAQSTVWASPSVAPVRPDELHNFDGCLIDNVQHHPGSVVMYAVVPKEARVDVDSRRHYWVVALQLPDFKLLSRIGPLDEVPTLLLDPGGTHLLVQDRTARVYRVPDMKPMKGSRTLAYIDEFAHWSRDGRIVDGDRILDASGRLLQTVSGDALAPDSFRLKWQRHRPDGTFGLNISFADSTGDRMLFVAGWDARGDRSVPGSGLMTYDVGTGRIISTIDTPYRASGADPTRLETPTAHLVPGTDTAVLEEYDWRPFTEGQEQQLLRFKTGRIAIYDVKRGKLLRTLQLDPAPGFFSQAIGFSPDGSLMYYGSTARIYAVDLTGAREPVVLPKVRIRDFSGFPPVPLVFASH